MNLLSDLVVAVHSTVIFAVMCDQCPICIKLTIIIHFMQICVGLFVVIAFWR